MSIVKNILLPGAGGFAAINIIKTLKSTNIFKGRIIVSDSNPLSSGFYLADRWYVLPKISESNYFEKLLEIVRVEEIDVILPTSGFDILPLSKNKEVLKNMGVTCFFSDYNTINLCNNKFDFYKTVKKGGFLTPKFSINPSTINFFPIYAKPIFGKGSRDNFLIENKQHLNFIQNNYSEMLYSEYLPGKELTIDVLCDLNAKPIVAIPRERIETKAGISVKGKTILDEEISKFAFKIVKFLDIKGPSCIQIKQDKSGVYKLVEINPRLGGGTIMSINSGVNIPLIILKLLCNIDIGKKELEYKSITVLRYYQEIIINNK